MPGPLIGLGLLAGKTWFDNQTREKKLAEQQQLQDRFQMAVGSAGGAQQLGGDGLFQDQGPGSGLLADPTNLQNQFQFATTMMGIQGREQQGTTILNNVLDIAQTRRGNELDRIQNQQLEDSKLWNGDSQIVQGDGTHGMNGVRYKIFIPGSEGWTKNMQPIQSARLGIESFDRMIGMVDEFGTEAWGAQSAQMGILYEDLKARLAQAWEKGVLQKDEAEQLESALPNPSKIGALGWSAGSVKAALTEARALFERKIVNHQELVDPTGYMTQMLTGTAPLQGDKKPLPTVQDMIETNPNLTDVNPATEARVNQSENVQDTIAEKTDAQQQFGRTAATRQSTNTEQAVEAGLSAARGAASDDMFSAFNPTPAELRRRRNKRKRGPRGRRN